jgi:hypothetical protein
MEGRDRDVYRQLLARYVIDGRRKREPTFDQVLRSGSRRQARARSRPRLPWSVQVLLGMLFTIFCFACAVMTIVFLVGFFGGY